MKINDGVSVAVFHGAFGMDFYEEFAIVMPILVIGIAEWPQYARTVRASVLAEREKMYVDAAKALEFSKRRIMFRHLLPNTPSPILVISTVRVANAIIADAGGDEQQGEMPEQSAGRGLEPAGQAAKDDQPRKQNDHADNRARHGHARGHVQCLANQLTDQYQRQIADDDGVFSSFLNRWLIACALAKSDRPLYGPRELKRDQPLYGD